MGLRPMNPDLISLLMLEFVIGRKFWRIVVVISMFDDDKMDSKKKNLRRKRWKKTNEKRTTIWQQRRQQQQQWENRIGFDWTESDWIVKNWLIKLIRITDRPGDQLTRNVSNQGQIKNETIAGPPDEKMWKWSWMREPEMKMYVSVKPSNKGKVREKLGNEGW